MKTNKYVSFTTETINRAEIHEAEYNPRKISESSKKKLKKNIKENGLVQPIVVNRRTMNVVGGHQRLAIMDELMKGNDYQIPVAFIDVDDKKEVELNIFMNNASAQGEWDVSMLGDINNYMGGIDFEMDLGFDRSDLDIMFGEEFQKTAKVEFDDFSADPLSIVKKETPQMTAEDYRALKKESREKAKAENEENGSFNLEKSDYTVTVVFPNNKEKADFMRKVRKDPKEKYIKSTVIFDISKGVYDLSVFNT